MSCLGKTSKSGPELGIQLDGGNTYTPGDTITGLVYRRARIVSPDSSLTVSMTGTASTSQLFKDRKGVHTWGIKLLDNCQTMFRAPLHIENGGHQEWAFELPVPLYADPKVNNGRQALSYIPLDTTDHELPPSYLLGDGNEERESACIQYVIEAKLTVEVHGKTEVFEAICPVKIIQLTPDAPIADFKSRRIRYTRKISSQSLIPGSEDVRLSTLQRIRKNFSFSSDPELIFDVFVDVPRIIQLDNPTPIPIKLVVAPDWQKTSPIIQNVPQEVKLTSIHIWIVTETSIDKRFGGRRTEVDLGVVQALNKLKTNLQIPFTRQWEPIDLGELSGLRIGLQDTGFPQQWNFAQSGFTHSFCTYNMMVTNGIAWWIQGEIAGVRFDVGGEADLLILRPSDDRVRPEATDGGSSRTTETEAEGQYDESWIRPPVEEAAPAYRKPDGT
ncbi:hypothetical protein FMUND_9218 [Fusarium mundagurra]|uniref:Arrestin-like N-terminal domain-containing protein n=1 Tax=Fusarium mundagurra TaxID=1567541 RepID=A0A8H5YED8_9HYPO|nr:hypothetical protein FMUND_9218 [Fusarium mundagurra]